MPEKKKFEIDWFLVAAIAAAPACWWLLSISVAVTKSPDLLDFVSQRFLMVAVLYPVLEEVVFRGLLQGWLRRRPWGRESRLGLSNANLLVSALFTAMHMARQFSYWSIAVFAPSLIFGYFRDRYGNLTVPIALHVFYNAGIVLLFAL